MFLEEAEKMGTLEQILEDAGYSKGKRKVASPKFISVQRVTLETATSNCSTFRLTTTALQNLRLWLQE